MGSMCLWEQKRESIWFSHVSSNEGVFVLNFLMLVEYSSDTLYRASFHLASVRWTLLLVALPLPRRLCSYRVCLLAGLLKIDEVMRVALLQARKWFIFWR